MYIECIDGRGYQFAEPMRITPTCDFCVRLEIWLNYLANIKQSRHNYLSLSFVLPSAFAVFINGTQTSKGQDAKGKM